MPTIDARSAPGTLGKWLEGVQAGIDAELARRLATPADLVATDPSARLWEAFRYAALGPGKRLRPALAVAAAEAIGGDGAVALPAAAALEMIHAYTLVHDDLPAMDDDDERRGRPTVHRRFDEATAILAGDGLLTLGFGALADLGARAADAVAVLARRAGPELLGGQARDLALAAAPRALSLGELEQIHEGKTGALFSAATELGAIAAGASVSERAALARYGMAIGIAFQHADDRDDHDFPELAAAATERIRELCAEALAIASRFGARSGSRIRRANDPGRLTEIAQWIAGAA